MKTSYLQRPSCPLAYRRIYIVQGHYCSNCITVPWHLLHQAKIQATIKHSKRDKLDIGTLLCILASNGASCPFAAIENHMEKQPLCLLILEDSF